MDKEAFEHLERWPLACEVGMEWWDTHKSHVSGPSGHWLQCDCSRGYIVETRGPVIRRWEENEIYKPQFFRVSRAPSDSNGLFTISQVLPYLILPWPVLKIGQPFWSFICKFVRQKNYCWVHILKHRHEWGDSSVWEYLTLGLDICEHPFSFSSDRFHDHDTENGTSLASAS